MRRPSFGHVVVRRGVQTLYAQRCRVDGLEAEARRVAAKWPDSEVWTQVGGQRQRWGATATQAVEAEHGGSTTPVETSAEEVGVYWQRTETDPPWLAPIICPFDGGWEVSRGSRAEQIIRGTPEFKDCHKACMAYLKSGENYQHGAAMHREAGSLEEFHRQLEWIADDYSLRVCVNDHWHIGDSVANPGPADGQQPPGYVPMRQRIASAAGKGTQREAAPESVAAAYSAVAETTTPAVTAGQPSASPDASVRQILVDRGTSEIGIGTGYCVAPGRFVTARHVVEGGQAFGVDEGGRSLDAAPSGVSGVTDAALVECPESTAAPVAVGPDPQPGDEVRMVGHPYGGYVEFHGTVTDVGPATKAHDILDVLTPGTKVVTIAGEGVPGESGGPCFVNGRVAGHVVGGDPSAGEVYVVPMSDIAPELQARASTQRSAEPASQPMAQPGEAAHSYSGAVPYRASVEVPAAVRQAADLVVKSSNGTAWPVAADTEGTIYATCAHCDPERDGEVLAIDEAHDCAAYRAAGDGGAIPLAHENAPVGSRCWIVGYPVKGWEERIGATVMPRQHTITPATVSGYGHLCDYDTMQIDGYAAGGNSGGVIVNEQGEAIGLYTSGCSESQQGGCVPISQVKQSLGLTQADVRSSNPAPAADQPYSSEAEAATSGQMVQVWQEGPWPWSEPELIAEVPANGGPVGFGYEVADAEQVDAHEVERTHVGMGVGVGAGYPVWPGYGVWPGMGPGFGVGVGCAVPFSERRVAADTQPHAQDTTQDSDLAAAY